MVSEEKYLANQVWDILVAEAGASEAQRTDFVHSFPTPEYRFQGDLGFGGKVWYDHGRIKVNCYTEDITNERLDIISRVNAKLAAFT